MTAVTTNILLDPAGRELIRGLTACGRRRLSPERAPAGKMGGGVYSVVYMGALSRLILLYFCKKTLAHSPSIQYT